MPPQFSTVEDLFAFLEMPHDGHRHHPLAPEQRDLGPGSAFVEFVDIDRHILRFGSALRPVQIGSLAQAAGGKMIEAGGAISRATFALHRNLLTSSVYSRLNTDGVYEMVPKAHVWPIPLETFAAAQRHSFDMRVMDASNSGLLARTEINRAFSAMKRHVTKVTSLPERRPYGEFVRELFDLIGQWSVISRTGDRELTLGFGDNSEAQSAKEALDGVAFHTRPLVFNDRALVIRDRSEPPYGEETGA